MINKLRASDKSNRPMLIAEVSGNHNGSIDLAKQTILAAHEAGADAVKIQTYEPQTMTLDVDLPDFQVTQGIWRGHNLYELYEKAHTPFAWHKELFSFAKENGVYLFSTPFDETAVDLLESLDCPAYKIASFEMTDLPLIEYVAKTRKPMVISTGMATLEEIGEAVETARSAGNRELTLMHCISAYPTELEETKLDSIRLLRETFGVDVGFSDHTLGSEAALLSIQFGATMVEKHFILSRDEGGVDSKFSLNKEELAQLVMKMSAAASAVASISGLERSPREMESLKFRRSLYFSRDMKRGDIIKPPDIRRVRPGYGDAPKNLESAIGRKLIDSVIRGQAVNLEKHTGTSSFTAGEIELDS